MESITRVTVLCCLLSVVIAGSRSSSLAGCNCGGGAVFSGVNYAAPATFSAYEMRGVSMGMSPSEPMMSAPLMAPQYGSPVMMAPQYGSPAPIGGGFPQGPLLAPAAGGTDYGTTTPPPGTLGQTYRRYTRPIPTEKHPRAAMLEVFHVAKGLKLTVHGMDGFLDKEGVWHFETKKPLLPGTTNIRKVLVFDKEDFLVEEMVRSVRLIPDRIVELEY